MADSTNVFGLLSVSDVADRTATHLGLMRHPNKPEHTFRSTLLFRLHLSKSVLAILKDHQFEWVSTNGNGSAPNLELLHDALASKAIDEKRQRVFDTMWRVVGKSLFLCAEILPQDNTVRDQELVVVRPCFLPEESESEALPQCHTRLLEVLLKHGPRDISEAIQKCFPANATIPFRDIGLGGAKWISELFRNDFDSPGGEVAFLESNWGLNLSPSPRGKERIVPVEAQELILSQWRRQLEDRLDTIPGLKRKSK